MPADEPHSFSQSRAGGWFRAFRSPLAFEILKENPNAFILAYVIAHRARWNSDAFNPHNLELGEALLGDAENIGMSEQNYRTAKAQLKKWGLATFKPTNKGTIAKLTDTRLFSALWDESNGQANSPITGSQQAANRQPTTNNKDNKDNKGIPALAGGGLELPRGFPGTEAEALIPVDDVGCPQEFAANLWNKAMSRGGMAADGDPIRSWRNFLAGAWELDKSERARRQRQSGPSRNAGTFNAEGTSATSASDLEALIR